MKSRTLARCAAFLGAMALLPAAPLAAAVRAPADMPPLFGGNYAFRFAEEEAVPEAIPSAPSAESPPEESAPASRPAESAPESLPPKESAPESSALPESGASLSLPAAYKVLDAGSGEVMSLSPFAYICGVTAAEIPMSFHPEAVKAQAVAAHSYALRQMGLQLQNPDPDLKGAFLSTDPAHFQSYLSEEERRELWGEAFEENEAALESAVEEVLGCILVYEGEPAAAAFHSISSGRTESDRRIHPFPPRKRPPSSAPIWNPSPCRRTRQNGSSRRSGPRAAWSPPQRSGTARFRGRTSAPGSDFPPPISPWNAAGKRSPSAPGAAGTASG